MNETPTIEQRIFKLKFPNDEFHPIYFEAWVNENEREAYQLSLQVAKGLEWQIKLLREAIANPEYWKELLELNEEEFDDKIGAFYHTFKPILLKLSKKMKP